MMTHLHNRSHVQKQTPPFSLRPTWQRLELCWHLSSLSGLILWLCSHGVRGKAGVAMATPVDGAIELWERRAQGGAAATHQHLYFHHPHSLKHSFSPVSILCKSATLSVTAITSITINSNHCYFNPGNESVINFHFPLFILKKSKINKNKQNVQSSLHPGFFSLASCILPSYLSIWVDFFPLKITIRAKS